MRILSEEKKPNRAQIFRHFRIESRNKNQNYTFLFDLNASNGSHFFNSKHLITLQFHSLLFVALAI